MTWPYGCSDNFLKIWNISIPRERNVTGKGLSVDDDDDGDGVNDILDLWPLDINEWEDTDSDGTGDKFRF